MADIGGLDTEGLGIKLFEDIEYEYNNPAPHPKYKPHPDPPGIPHWNISSIPDWQDLPTQKDDRISQPKVYPASEDDNTEDFDSDLELFPEPPEGWYVHIL